MKLSLIIPVYNEVRLIRSFWTRLQQAPIAQCAGIDAVELVVVDDGSKDGTTDVLHSLAAEPFVFADCNIEAAVRFLPLTQNQGKGHAVRHGINHSTGDIVLIQDADLEYSPDDYPALFKPIIDQDADAVFGSRFIGTPRRVLYFWHAQMNAFLTLLANMTNDINLTDMETCYKAMRGNLARSLRLTSDRFGIEPELTSRLAKARARIYEVPVSYRGRTYAEGKKIRAKDGLAALWHILRFALLDTEPFRPGLMQTLTALDASANELYTPLLAKAIRGRVDARQPLRILEIGAGIGSMTRELATYGDVDATDISADYVERLKERYADAANVKSFLWDATQPPLPGMGNYDLIVSFNVLEHIEDDGRALTAWRSLLAQGGQLVILVPHGPRLYTPIDKALGHFRRYTKDGLTAKLASNGFRVETTFFGNALGILGWFLNGTLLRRADLPTGQLRLYRVIKRLFGWAERQIEKVTGLSVIAVACRETTGADKALAGSRTA